MEASMPLETSTTIAGLNALWPTGTDPKSEGDDHLRLIKEVLQLTFPNADGTKIPFVDPLLGPNGGPGAPTFSFGNDANIGMYMIGADRLGFSVNSVQEFEVAVGGIAARGSIWVGNGGVALPTYAFNSDPDTGMYRTGPNAIGFAVGGLASLSLDLNVAQFFTPVIIPQGVAATPGIVFDASSNTGIFRIASNQMGFALAGVERARLSNANDNANTLQTRAFADARFAPVSDARLKTAVEAMGSPWEDIGWLRPVSYEWLEPDDWGRPAGRCVGLIAQEVAEIIPNAVRDNDEVLSLDLLPLVSLLIRAVQDLKLEIDALNLRTAPAKG
jgi:hypothetical protein